MRNPTLVVALTLLLTAGLVLARERRESAVESQPPAAVEDGISVWFSPDGGCTAAVVREIDAAHSTIDLQAYSFTSTPIVHAITDAFARGVKVTVVLDKSQETERYTGATFLLNHHVPTYIDHRHAIAHNKIILIDGRTIITGSFNFTNAAEHENAENLLVIHDRPRLYVAYEENFKHHLGHSDVYTGPREHGESSRSERER